MVAGRKDGIGKSEHKARIGRKTGCRLPANSPKMRDYSSFTRQTRPALPDCITQATLICAKISALISNKESEMNEQKPLIAFPTHFDLKIMGAHHPDFAAEILKAVQTHAPDTTEEHVKLRPSTNGNYLGATVTVYAENQEHLDNIYRSVTSHPMVKVVF